MAITNVFASQTAEVITNFEVMEKLQQYHHSSDFPKQAQNVRDVTSYTFEYLQTTPIAKVNKNQITQFIRLFEEYDLTHLEAIQLLNFLPSSEVELHLLIENCSERYTEEQIANLLTEILKISENSQSTSTLSVRTTTNEKAQLEGNSFDSADTVMEITDK
jgi:DNA-directed RNA polymerase subunit F